MLRCPMCLTGLRVIQREGVEIDLCPSCRGIWLDRGELEKLLARSEPSYHEDDDQRPRERARPEESYGYEGGMAPRKRESFWGRIFDFD